MTFQLDKCTKGLTFWIHSKPCSRKYFRQLRSQGYNWIGLTVVDYEWQYRHDLFLAGKEPPTFSDMHFVAATCEAANAEGLRVVVRQHFMGVHYNEARVGNVDIISPTVNLARVFKDIQKPSAFSSALQWNCFQPAGEWSQLKPWGQFTDSELAEATKWTEQMYSQMVPLIRAEVPDLTLVQNPAGWAHIITKEHEAMALDIPNAFIAADYHQTVNVKEDLRYFRDYWAARGKKVALVEYIPDRDDILAEARLLGIPASEWDYGKPGLPGPVAISA